MTERVLDRAPGMLGLFARAGVAMVPGAARLPFLGGREPSGELPETVLALREVAIDRERLAAYQKVCSFPLRDRLPASYPHVPAFALHLKLMTDPSFPFPALGLVHIANRIVQHRPVDAGERLGLTVWTEQLEPHPRGRQFVIRTEARSGEELVWEESSTILRREQTGEGRGPAPAETDDAPPPMTATWRLPGDLGRRYGSVSGDLNPIHIHPLSARLFGFQSAIAHGMWTMARCLAALDPRLPERFGVEVRFQKPIMLPATVEFAERQDGEGIAFAVSGAGKGTPHLAGRVSFGSR